MEADSRVMTRVDELKAKSKGAIAIGPFGSKMKSDCYVPSGVPVTRPAFDKRDDKYHALPLGS